MAHPFGFLPARFEPDPARVAAPAGLALVVPGRSYSPSAPLLEFARQSLLAHGWAVQQLWWDAPAYDGDGAVPGDPRCVAGLRENPARQLVVGGLADTIAWDASVAADLASTGGCDVLEVPDADHAMWRAGDAVRSAEIQVEVASAIESFLTSLEGR